MAEWCRRTGAKHRDRFSAHRGRQGRDHGDFCMTAEEVQKVIEALRAGGIQIAALHNHMLDESPRLFFPALLAQR